MTASISGPAVILLLFIPIIGLGVYGLALKTASTASTPCIVPLREVENANLSVASMERYFSKEIGKGGQHLPSIYPMHREYHHVEHVLSL